MKFHRPETPLTCHYLQFLEALLPPEILFTILLNSLASRKRRNRSYLINCLRLAENLKLRDIPPRLTAAISEHQSSNAWSVSIPHGDGNPDFFQIDHGLEDLRMS